MALSLESHGKLTTLRHSQTHHHRSSVPGIGQGWLERQTDIGCFPLMSGHLREYMSKLTIIDWAQYTTL